MKTITFAGSNSSKSINHELVKYVASQNQEIELIRLDAYTVPMYGIDREENDGIPQGINDLDSKLAEAANLVISVAEHNGNFTAFFKNTLDWLSRNNRDFLKGKKIIVLGTSPGRGGASSAIEIAANTFPKFGGEIITTLSLPSFNHNFENGKPTDAQFTLDLKTALAKL